RPAIRSPVLPLRRLGGPHGSGARRRDPPGLRAPLGLIVPHRRSADMKKPPAGCGRLFGARSGALYVLRARPLRALLDLELDLLAATQAVEVQRRGQAVAMEEVLLPIVSGDEAEAAVGDDLLDSTGGHSDLHSSRTCKQLTQVSSRGSRPHAHATTLGRGTSLACLFEARAITIG